MDRVFIAIASLFGLLAVAAGAIGSHALAGKLTPEMVNRFEIAVRYQMYHALALFAAAWMCTRTAGKLPVVAGWCFIAGVCLFSGSLYVLCLTNRGMGPMAPAGGLALMAGWLLLALSAFPPVR